MKIEAIIKSLKKNAASVTEAHSFKAEPGIYAFFFQGKQFPIKNHKPTKKEIIYIGKTQSSGLTRVFNDHFGTGKTKSSTLRRTLGALLRQELKLKVLTSNGASSFKFNDPSEKKLTDWMNKNLLIAFQPLEPGLVRAIEEDLINQLQPVLNIEGNSSSKYYRYLIDLRKECALSAQDNSTRNKKPKRQKARQPRQLDYKESNPLEGSAGCAKTIIKWIIILLIISYMLSLMLEN